MALPGDLPATVPAYQAFGVRGEYWRPARTIGELPYSLRNSAMGAAQNELKVNIHFGVPIGQTNGMTAREVEADHRKWLKFKGCDLPLVLFWTTPSRAS